MKTCGIRVRATKCLSQEHQNDGMSALPPKADIRRCKINIRYGPEPDISRWCIDQGFSLEMVSAGDGAYREHAGACA